MLPLLRAPPFHGAQVTVSTLLKSWAETEISDAVEHELAAAIIQARVGGRFWAPCEAAEPTKPPNNPVTVAVLPENAARARFLWQHVLLRAEAANLLVVFPHLKGAFAALANEVIKAGAGILEQPGPHEVLDRACSRGGRSTFTGPMAWRPKARAGPSTG